MSYCPMCLGCGTASLRVQAAKPLHGQTLREVRAYAAWLDDRERENRKHENETNARNRGVMLCYENATWPDICVGQRGPCRTCLGTGWVVPCSEWEESHGASFRVSAAEWERHSSQSLAYVEPEAPALMLWLNGGAPTGEGIPMTMGRTSLDDDG